MAAFFSIVVVGGQVLHNVHGPRECAGHPCWVHHPSNHHMRAWPLLWRGKPERMCECGVGHPDPDHLDYLARTQGTQSAQAHGTHGCCARGCCARPTFARMLETPGCIGWRKQ